MSASMGVVSEYKYTDKLKLPVTCLKCKGNPILSDFEFVVNEDYALGYLGKDVLNGSMTCLNVTLGDGQLNNGVNLQISLGQFYQTIVDTSPTQKYLS